MQVDLARYDDAVHSIYDAALHSDRWPGVLARIADIFEAPRGMLFTWVQSPTRGGFAFSHNVPTATMAYWTAKGMHEDPFVEAGLRLGLMVEGVAVNAADMVPWNDLVKSDFYQKVWAPVGIAHMCCGVVFDATDTHKLPTAVSFMRDMDDSPFQSHHPTLLRRLLAHLARSLGLMFHLRDNHLQVAASLTALNRMTSGIALIDAARRIQFANAAAEAMFGSGDIVRLSSPRGIDSERQMHLSNRLAQYEHSLQLAITYALRPLTADVEQSFSESLLLPAENGQPRCVVHVAPLAQSQELGNVAARAIVILYDLQKAGTVPAELLCKLFAMTPGEARAALQLTHGGSIGEMSTRLGVSTNTFKTQLQAAYLKSGTHRQMDLLKLLLALAS